MCKNKFIILGLAIIAVLLLSTMVAAPALAGKGDKGGGKVEFLVIDKDSIDETPPSIVALSGF